MKRRDKFIMGLKLSKEHMFRLEEELDSFIETYKIDCKIPVDIFKIADQLGFDVRGADFPDEVKGIVLVNEEIKRIEGFNSNKVISYNHNMPFDIQRFTVAHEIAHYIEAKVENPDVKVLVAAKEKTRGYGFDLDEQKKDYIAAALLVPKDDLKGKMQAFNVEDEVEGEKFVELMSKFYDVNIEVMRRRVDEIRELLDGRSN